MDKNKDENKLEDKNKPMDNPAYFVCAEGFPMILCRDETTAKKVGEAYEKLGIKCIWGKYLYSIDVPYVHVI